MMTVFSLKPFTSYLTREQFYELCLANPDQPMERTAQGELILMAPVGGEGGNQEANLIGRVWAWNDQTQLGYVFSSQTVFSIPNGPDRSPDVAWITKERWDALSHDERRKFPPICPDFVIELRSASDNLQPLQDKMKEYSRYGVRLGWLIDPQKQQVEIYRLGQTVQAVPYPAVLSGEEILPGFELAIQA